MAKGDCVLAKNRRLVTVRGIVSFVMAAILTVGMVGCGGDSIETPQLSNAENAAKTKIAGQLSEVAPPKVIQQLSQSLEAYQPQVTILSPSPDEVFQDTKVSAKLQVQDLPIFQDPELGMGPHLEVILDNQPYTMVYDLNQPLVFPDLEPGTHTLRVFASSPWHESFKNEGAYAQTTFHIFTKTTDNNPDPAQPLLTYSRPTGSYGAEPIMLDFYLTNAPLHLVAQENPEDEIADWRIRATVNGESFVLDRWQPVYLKGFKPGKNWVKLEFLDEQGNPVKNVFNNTVRLINYEPKGKDTLSKLVRGEISALAARGIVEQNYKLQPTPTPSPAEIPSVTPPVEEEPTSEPATPEAQTTDTEAKQKDLPKSGDDFNRFQPSTEVPSTEAPVVVPEKSEKTAEAEKSVTPEVEASTPTEKAASQETKKKDKPSFANFLKRLRGSSEVPSTEAPVVVPEKSDETAEAEKSVTPEVEASTPTEKAAPQEAKKKDKPTFANFLKRFQRPATVSEPSSIPTVVPQEPEIKPEPEEKSTIPSNLPTALEEPKPVIKPVPTEPLPSQKLKLEEVKAPSNEPTVVPQEPEIKPEPEEKSTIPSNIPTAVEEPKPVIQPVPTELLPSQKLKLEGVLKASESSDPEFVESPKLP
ncbi:MAG: hypothetical protein U7123_11505 [Potamolinea sp.]